MGGVTVVRNYLASSSGVIPTVTLRLTYVTPIRKSEHMYSFDLV